MSEHPAANASLPPHGEARLALDVDVSSQTAKHQHTAMKHCRSCFLGVWQMPGPLPVGFTGLAVMAFMASHGSLLNSS